MTRLSTALLLGLATASAAISAPPTIAVAAPTAAPSSIDPDRLPDMRKLDTVPVPYRLRMTVKMLRTSDSSEGPGNTEDEVYFALAGVRKKGDADFLLARRTVRPGISRDFWEMGKHSASSFDATIFEGKLAAIDQASFAFLLAEQDNKQLALLNAIFAAASGVMIEALIAEAATSNGGGPTDLGMQNLKDQVDKLFDEMKGRGDELLGGFEITVKRGKLSVRAPSQASAKLISSTHKNATVELDGAGGKYRVELVLEDPSNGAPKTKTYLGREDDDCGAENLWVEKVGGGSTLVRKGDGGVPVRIKDDVFHWHCGSMSEDDHSNMPDETKLVEVTRESAGDTIWWDCYHERTAQPQYTW